MTAQGVLPMAPEEAVQISEAAALVQEGDGSGRVYLRGDLAYMWDRGDEAARRLAAVQLVGIKAAKVYEVAGAFGIGTETLRQWRLTAASAGAVGLVPSRRGPKGPSKLTAEVVAQIRARRAGGEPIAAIAEAVGVSERSVHTVLAERQTHSQGPLQVQEPVADQEGGDAGAAQQEADAGAAQEADDQLSLWAGDGGEDAGRAETAPGDQSREDGARAESGPGGQGAEDVGGQVLARPVPRVGERWAARGHLINQALPVFTCAGQVPLAGLFLALPGLGATGLLASAAGIYQLPGFYGLTTMLLEGVFRVLAGEPRAEGATRFDAVVLGRVLGMDRAPEVKTIRRKMAHLAAQEKADELMAVMGKAHLARKTHTDEDEDDEAAVVLYVDGHVRTYTGTRKIAKTHNPRSRFPAPATVETWVSDADGDPVLVVMAEPGASLAGELRRLLPALRAAVGDERRVLVGFDRGGWSPALFAHMGEQGFDVLIWRKGSAEGVSAEEFTEHLFTDATGLARKWRLAQTVVKIPIKGAADFPMRQITRLDDKTGRQVHILTTRTDLSPAEVVYRMGSRWRQENHFRYARAHFDLDSHDCYAVSDDDPDRSVPNPAKEAAKKTVAALAARAERERARAERALLVATTRGGGEVVLTNQAYNAITAQWHAAEDELAAAQEENAETPTRVPLGQVAPGQQVLDTETKALSHVIKMAAFNTITALARAIRIHTGYARADDEAHPLVRQVLRHTGDIIPDTGAGTLRIRLDPMPTTRQTRAVAELCQHLSATATTYPGTNLRLHYEIKNRL